MQPFFPLLKVVARRPDLSMTAKLVHACILAYAGLKEARPTQERIATETGLCRKSVSRAVRELTGVGLVVVETGRSGRASTYQLRETWDILSRDSKSHRDSESQGCGTESPSNRGQKVPPEESEEYFQESGANNAEVLTQAERLTWLRETLGNFAPNLGKPDAAILKRIEASAAGASEDEIEAALHRLYAAGLQDRMRSWALMLRALPDELGRAAA
ncbi:MAG: helix-turn-helix domain-containing protein [Acidobacteria bacterium]|nr:helix-turn-helix domain-containing protein [Acidobacteriota bacterium]